MAMARREIGPRTIFFHEILHDFYQCPVNNYSYSHFVFSKDGNPVLQVNLRPNYQILIIFTFYGCRVQICSFTRADWQDEYILWGEMHHWEIASDYRDYLTPIDARLIYESPHECIDIWCMHSIFDQVLEILPPRPRVLLTPPPEDFSAF